MVGDGQRGVGDGDDDGRVLVLMVRWGKNQVV